MNFDGLPGPTHNYSGLAHGNFAAERNAQQVANPHEAALQGLAKMRAAAQFTRDGQELHNIRPADVVPTFAERLAPSVPGWPTLEAALAESSASFPPAVGSRTARAHAGRSR